MNLEPLTDDYTQIRIKIPPFSSETCREFSLKDISCQNRREIEIRDYVMMEMLKNDLIIEVSIKDNLTGVETHFTTRAELYFKYRDPLEISVGQHLQKVCRQRVKNMREKENVYDISKKDQ